MVASNLALPALCLWCEGEGTTERERRRCALFEVLP